MEFVDLTGQTYGYWTVLRRGDDRAGQVSWRCRCVCGTEADVFRTALRRSKWPSRSCGCKTGELIRKARQTHGKSRTGNRTYTVWVGLRQRCRVDNEKNKHYAGRGITVCERWSEFENFLADMGEKPAGLSIDRIDTDGNYEKANCRWATPLEQTRNRRKETKPRKRR